MPKYKLKRLFLIAALCVLLGALFTICAWALDDGDYSVDVTMEGGTGRVTIESPCTLTVADGGVMTATVVLSSSNYTYMKVGDTVYYNSNEGGNSTFIIPVAALDTPITVYAETVAMSEPHEIEYTLTFASPAGADNSGEETSASGSETTPAVIITEPSAETEPVPAENGSPNIIIIIAISVTVAAAAAAVLFIALRRKSPPKR